MGIVVEVVDIRLIGCVIILVPVVKAVVGCEVKTSVGDVAGIDVDVVDI